MFPRAVSVFDNRSDTASSVEKSNCSSCESALRAAVFPTLRSRAAPHFRVCESPCDARYLTSPQAKYSTGLTLPRPGQTSPLVAPGRTRGNTSRGDFSARANAVGIDPSLSQMALVAGPLYPLSDPLEIDSRRRLRHSLPSMRSSPSRTQTREATRDDMSLDSYRHMIDISVHTHFPGAANRG